MNPSTDRSYGGLNQTSLDAPVDRHIEELNLLGYSILPDVFPAAVVADLRNRVDEVYLKQVAEFGETALRDIGELDLCRAPLLYDPAFIAVAMHAAIHQVLRRVLGGFYILNLQNAIINRPDRPHHQSAWHRDLPHQNWIASQSIAVGALLLIDDFTCENGGTQLLPGSHKRETTPSSLWIERHAKQIEATAGSVLLFDAMILHRAGRNASTLIRRGINHLFTIPIIKQQYDLPRGLGADFQADADTRRLLGYTSQVPVSVLEWRQQRTHRLLEST